MFASVRVRIVLATLVVVAASFAIGAFTLVTTLHQSLRNGVVNDATSQAHTVGGAIASGSASSRLPVHNGVATQVVQRNGTVFSATPDLAGRPALSSLHPRIGQSVVLSVPGVLPGDDDPDVGVAYTVDSPRGPLTVYAFATVEQLEASTRWLAIALSIGLPVLLALSGVLAWLLTGRALRPVEDIRREVAHISAHDLHHRVPEPAGDDEVGRLARTMNAMLRRLEVATEEQRRFVSDASHELRSPLGGLLAQVEVAKAHPETADWDAVADAVTDEGGRIWSIVDDLLLLAKADEGYLRPRLEQLDLDELVLDEARRLKARGRVDVDARQVSAGRVHGDRSQLSRALRNLADNAERHARSAVRFMLERDGAWLDLGVVDDGPGIPPDQRERVFARFARLDEARDRAGGGTGLGLAIVGEVVKAHGGEVFVADEAVGTHMVVRLPVAEEA